MGWFGFNPGSQLAISGDNAVAVAGIFITTNFSTSGCYSSDVLDLN
jgi:Amt family ammonium transporter